MIDLETPPPVDYRLELYLHLIERDRTEGCSERLLADEIHRLRKVVVAQGDEIARLRDRSAGLEDALVAPPRWPTLVALVRRVRGHYTPRDRNPDDPVFELVFDAEELERGYGSLEWIRHPDRPGAWILRLEEVPE